MLAADFDESSDEGGGNGNGKADAHALQEGEAAVEAGEAAGKGDEGAVVKGYGDKHGKHGEDRHGTWGDLKGRGRGEAAIHGAGLLEGKGALLGCSSDDEDACNPDRPHADD